MKRGYRNTHNLYKNTYKQISKTPVKEGDFKKGRYRGTPISENQDLDYLLWYWNNDGECKYSIKRINELSNGDCIYYENKIVTQEAKKSYESVKKNIDVFKKLKVAILTFTRNPKENGIYDHFGMLLRFKDVKRCDYNGYDYYIPEFDGKGMRVKNKKFKIYANPIETNDGLVFNIIKLEKIK